MTTRSTSCCRCYTTDRPEVHDVIARMRRLFDEYDERVLIGEIYLPVERLVRYYGEDCSGAHLPFNFQLILAPWDARHIAPADRGVRGGAAGRGLAELGAGQSRQAPHRHPGRARSRRASRRCCCSRCAARRRSTTATRSACATCDIPPDRVQDPFEKNVPGMGLGRDPERTPMQWDASPDAGFTHGRALAADRGRLPDGERRSAARGAGLDAVVSTGA